VNDEELRQLIRAAIQKHAGIASPESASAREPLGQLRRDAASGGALTLSFGQYRLERAADDTMCIIEPAVQCNHCGFCKCHGH
jgi:hypothetical protein